MCILFSNLSVIVKFCLFLFGKVIQAMDFPCGAVLVSP